MKQENFQSLLESVREVGRVKRGEAKPSREFVIELPDDIAKPTNGYAICIETDDPELLIPHKIYNVTFFEDDLIGVIDEEGEKAVYPSNFFIPINLPIEITQALETHISL